MACFFGVSRSGVQVLILALGVIGSGTVTLNPYTLKT